MDKTRRPADTATHRWCSKCKQWRLLEQYSSDKTRGLKRVCNPCQAEYMRSYNSDPERKTIVRWARASKKYGITKEEYEALWERSQGRCEICRVPLQHILDTPIEESMRYRSSIDHCHTTGAVRGLLCGACNSGIGYMADDPARLRSAAAYLER